MIGSIVRLGLTLFCGAVIFTTYGLYQDHSVREAVEKMCKDHEDVIKQSDGTVNVEEMQRWVKDHLSGWQSKMTYASSITELNDWLKQKGWLV